MIAQAFNRVRMYQREHSIAANLQRSMLPDALPVIVGTDVGAVYRAGSQEADVGGDWYEVLPLDEKDSCWR